MVYCVFVSLPDEVKMYKEYCKAIQATGLGLHTIPLYLACGLVGEVHELNYTADDTDSIKDEVSDVVWYFSYLVTKLRLRINLDEYSYQDTCGVSIFDEAPNITQMVNKHYRKVSLNKHDEAEIYLHDKMHPVLDDFAQSLIDFIYNNGLTLEEVLVFNINKTYKRYGVEVPLLFSITEG